MADGNMFTDFASSAGDVISGVGSKLAQGIGDAIVASDPIVGAIADPFIETTREKKQAKRQAFAERQMEFAEGQMERNIEQQKLRDQANEIKRQDMAIASNKEMASKNFMGQLDTIPEYQNLTDVQKNNYLASEPAQDMVNFRTISRVGIQAMNDPKKMPSFKRALNMNDMDLVQKDGKQYIVQPGGKEAIELNDDNFATMMNTMQAQAAEELKAHANFVAQESNLMGQSKNNMMKSVIANSVSGDPTKAPKSMASAQKEIEAFLKVNNFTPQEQRIHYVNTGLTKVFEDGNISADEKMEVMAQLEFLGEAIGIKSRQTVDGGIEVANPATQGWVPLKSFYDSLQAPGADIVADRFKALTTAGQGAPVTPFDQEFNELAGDIPEENVEAVKQSMAPLMEETGIDSKERKEYATAISDMLDFSTVEDNPDKLLRQVEALADEKDIDEDKLYELLPEDIKKSVGLQIAREAEAEQKRVLKAAEADLKKKRDRVKNFKREKFPALRAL